MAWGMNIAAEHLNWGVIDEGWRKGPWTAEEDRLLIEYVNNHGEGRWNSVARLAGLRRNGKSCRLRWVNYLRPDLKRGQITPHEESIILELHARWGNRWSTIARSLPGRTDNEIKNYWRTHFKKKTKGPSNSNSEKARTRLLKKQQFQQQQKQQQQQQQLNQIDMKKIMSLLDESENRVSTPPQMRQEITTTMYPHQTEEQGFYGYPNFSSETSVPEAEEDVLWDSLWNMEDIHAALLQPVQQACKQVCPV